MVPGPEKYRERLIDRVVTFERLVKGATDKIRQAGRGMPAVLIRQLANLYKVALAIEAGPGREIVVKHAELILRVGEESVTEPADRRDLQVTYDALIAHLRLEPARDR